MLPMSSFSAIQNGESINQIELETSNDNNISHENNQSFTHTPSQHIHPINHSNYIPRSPPNNFTHVTPQQQAQQYNSYYASQQSMQTQMAEVAQRPFVQQPMDVMPVMPAMPVTPTPYIGNNNLSIQSQTNNSESQWLIKAKDNVKTKHCAHTNARSTILNAVHQDVLGFPIPEHITNNWFNQTVILMNDVIDRYSGIDKKKMKKAKKTYEQYLKTVDSYFNKKCYRWNAKYWLMVFQYINQRFPDNNQRKAFVASMLRANVKLVKAQRFQPFVAAAALNGTKEINETDLLRNTLDSSFSGCNLGISDLYNNHKKRRDNDYLKLILTNIDKILHKPHTKTIRIGDLQIQWPSDYNSLIPVLIPPLPSPVLTPFASPVFPSPVFPFYETNLETNSINDTTNNHDLFSSISPISLDSPSSLFGPVHSATYSVEEQRYSPFGNLYNMNDNQHTNTNNVKY